MANDYKLELQLSAVSVELQRDMLALEDRVGKVVNRAVVKLTRWLRTHSVREISQEIGIAQKALKQRFRVERVKVGGQEHVRIWVGLMNVALHHLSKPSQTKAGAKVGGQVYEGAFLEQIYGSTEKVYIRTARNRSAGHATVADREGRTNKQPDRAFLDKSGGRFPVQVVAEEIEPVARKVLERYELRLNSRYQTILQQELNYALNVNTA